MSSRISRTDKLRWQISAPGHCESHPSMGRIFRMERADPEDTECDWRIELIPFWIHQLGDVMRETEKTKYIGSIPKLPAAKDYCQFLHNQMIADYNKRVIKEYKKRRV